MTTFTPHNYQLPAMEHLLHLRRCGLFAPMGSGKTVMTATALDRLSYVEDVYPALILAPKRVALSTWPEEPDKWAHLDHLRVVCAAGLEVKPRAAALRAEADLVTVNYDQLAWLTEFWGSDWPYRTVVADEWTKLKSFRIRQGGKRAGAFGKIAHTKVERFIGLTGTPSANGLKDLWGQLWFVDKGERLGKTFSAFEQRWFSKSRDGYGLEPHPWAMDEIMAAIRDVCLTVDGLPVDEPITNKLYVDLPPAARDLYKQMERKMFAEIEGREVSAVHAASRTNKCLAEGTEVLCKRGWVAIEDVTSHDQVWDGADWVSCAGSVYNGVLPVVVCWGAQVTPDHKLLTKSGWREAQEIMSGKPGERHERADVRLPDGVASLRECTTGAQREGDLVASLCVWTRGRAYRSELADGKQGFVKIVRVQTGADAHLFPWNARYDRAPGLGHVEKHGITVLKRVRQGLAELRRARRNGLRALAILVLRFLGGHGPDVSGRFDTGTAGQRRWLQPGELSLGFTEKASKQQAHKPLPNKTVGPCDGFASRCASGPETRDRVRTAAERLAGRPRALAPATARVYDVLNAGPRQRFVARGVGGAPFIAHNCLQIANGAVYMDPDDSDSPWEPLHDAKLEALDSVIAEAAGTPVLVAYAFKSDLARILKRYPQARQLDANPETIRRWNAGEIPVLVAHPASAGHGLNLQYGGNILAFYGIGWNLENHLQIIERIGPQRQKQAGFDRPVFVHYILAKHTVDDMVFDRLVNKKSVQDALLDGLKRRKETDRAYV